MLLSNFFEQLTYGELAQLALGGRDITAIAAEDYPAIVSHINLGLTDLYKRFPLKTNEVIIQLYDHIQTYYLMSKYAATNADSSEPIKYIMDSVYQPFTDNVLRIEQVFNEMGEERTLNDENDPLTVLTPQFNAVTIPYNESSNAIAVVYRAAHDRIVVTDTFDPATVELTLPHYLVEALMLYVTARVLSSTGGGQNLNEASAFMARYELACRQVSDLNLLNTENTSNHRLEHNGWV
jgi:hypothetical protein